ncbi:MAG: hydrogenase maturation nickel metallochaperone HypA [Pseudomonadota bacterium]
MHEMALSESVLSMIESSARQQGFSRVVGVHLAVGQLAGVDIEALRFSFDAVTRGTLADEAELQISPVQGEAWCMRCACTVQLPSRVDPCPLCGSHQLQVTGGNDMLLKSLEVE